MKWSEMEPIQRNALVAEKIFGRTIERSMTWGRPLMYKVENIRLPTFGVIPGSGGYSAGEHQIILTEEIPPYTTSMDAAWTVLRHVIQSKVNGKFSKASTKLMQWFIYDADLWGTDGKDAAEAICIAALKAVGSEVEL